MFDLIVIGDGIAARTVLAALDRNYKVLQIADSLKYPPASLAAGALASRYGARTGLSELGDLNVSSYQMFKKFVQQMDLGLTPLAMKYFIHASNSSEEKLKSFQNRWGIEAGQKIGDYLQVQEESFLIDPLDYLNLLETKRSCDLSQCEQTVLEINEQEVICCDGKKFQAPVVIDCTGAYIDHLKVDQKVAYGAYYCLPYTGLSENLAWNINGVNILYHSQRGELVIGATTQNDGSMLPNLALFASWRPAIDELFKFHQLAPIDWEQGSFVSGLRSKGKKRLPRFEWIERDQMAIFHVSGLYKNGLMYSVSALSQLQERVKLHSKLQL